MAVTSHSIKSTVRRHTDSGKKQSSNGNKNKVLKIAGCMDDNDAAELKAIIENGCERIETDP
jgi:hypothetical protein